MLKVIILYLVVVALILTEAVPIGSNSENVKESKLHCNRFCNSVKGEAYFEENSLTCRCQLIETIDDAEIALLRKNAQLLNLNIETTTSLSHNNKRKKRRIPRNGSNALLSHDDNILGQKPPLFVPQNRPLVGPLKPALVPPQFPPILPPRPPSVLPLHPTPLLPPNPLPLHPISHAEAARTLTDLRHKVRNLARNSQLAKNSQAHIHAIKTSLNNLSQRIALNPDQQARMAVNRARIAQARTARRRVLPGGGLLPRKPGLVGSAADGAQTTSAPQQEPDQQNRDSENDEDEVTVPKKFQKGIITQPKELYDD